MASKIQSIADGNIERRRRRRRKKVAEKTPRLARSEERDPNI